MKEVILCLGLLGLCSPVFADPDDLGDLRERSPDQSVSLKIPCGTGTDDVRVDAARFYFLRQNGGYGMAVTSEAYLIQWKSGTPTIVGHSDASGLNLEARDLDGDGIPEILVTYSTGAHGSGLAIYTFKDCELSLLPGAVFLGDADAPFLVPNKATRYPDVIAPGRDYDHDPTSGPAIEHRFTWNGSSYQPAPPAKHKKH